LRTPNKSIGTVSITFFTVKTKQGKQTHKHNVKNNEVGFVICWSIWINPKKTHKFTIRVVSIASSAGTSCFPLPNRKYIPTFQPEENLIYSTLSIHIESLAKQKETVRAWQLVNLWVGRGRRGKEMKAVACQNPISEDTTLYSWDFTLYQGIPREMFVTLNNFSITKQIAEAFPYVCQSFCNSYFRHLILASFLSISCRFWETSLKIFLNSTLLMGISLLTSGQPRTVHHPQVAGQRLLHQED
jgi:hypothetical protein